MPITINDLFEEDATYLTTPEQTPFEPVRNQAGLLATGVIGLQFMSAPVTAVVLAAFGSIYAVARLFKSRVTTLEEEYPSEGPVNVTVAREIKAGSKYLFFSAGFADSIYYFQT